MHPHPRFAWTDREAILAFIAETSNSKSVDEITLRPFADLHYRHYNVYWTLTPE